MKQVRILYILFLISVMLSCSKSISRRPASVDSINCPLGFIEVPENKHFGLKSFCLSKGYMRLNVLNGLPTTEAHYPELKANNLEEAKNYCLSLGKQYHLISNDHWQVLIRSILTQPKNWKKLGAELNLSNGESVTGLKNRSHIMSDVLDLPSEVNLIKSVLLKKQDEDLFISLGSQSKGRSFKEHFRPFDLLTPFGNGNITMTLSSKDSGLVLARGGNSIVDTEFKKDRLLGSAIRCVYEPFREVHSYNIGELRKVVRKYNELLLSQK